jgi:hypothetical protein
MYRGQARGLSGAARGGRMEWVDGELMRRKPAAGKDSRPRSLAGGSARGRVLHVEGKTTVPFLGLDGDGEATTVVAMVSGQQGGELAESGNGGRARGGNEVGEGILCRPTREDKLADPRGAATGR